VSAWTGRHFSQPYLEATVGAGVRRDEVELRHGSRATALTIDGDRDAACALLQELTDPVSDVWREVWTAESPPLRALVRDLDRLGWLLESDVAGRSRTAENVRRLELTRDRAQAWLATADANRCPTPSDNLALRVLSACRDTWRRSSPLTDAILRQVLDRADDGDDWHPAALAVCDVDDVAREVWTALQLDCMSQSAALVSQSGAFVPASLPDGPGINLLIEAERCAEALLSVLGESELVRLIDRPCGAKAAAPIVFQHRWYETVRYVDAAAGLLSYRLRPDLRALVLEYLREEMGHEIHEVRTCNELGVTDLELAEFAPLAWFAAYPELLATLAQQRPLSFLLSMTVAEGLPGSGRRLSERLLEQGIEASMAIDHDEIDRELNHEMVTRTMFAQLDWIDGATGCLAIADFLQIVEVAHHAWRLLSRLVDAGLPHSPRSFEISAETLGKACATS
jgi:hypothetical protein